jgi:hypothetical protein
MEQDARLFEAGRAGHCYFRALAYHTITGFDLIANGFESLDGSA